MPHPSEDELASLAIGGLPDPGVSAHVETCAECEASMAELRNAIAHLRTVPDIDDGWVAPPAGLWERVAAGLDEPESRDERPARASVPTAAPAADLPDRCAAFARTELAGLGRDQALVNGVLDGEWTEISPLWNWQFTWASAHLTAMADPCLIHFIGPEKPWLARSAGIVPMRYRAPYAGLPGAGAGLTRRAWPDRRRLGRALLRQWRASGPMLDYLGRFADEYTLIDPR